MIHPLIHLKPRSYLECKTFSGLATLPSSTLRYTSIVLRHKPFHNLVLDPLYNDVAISRSHVDRSCVRDNSAQECINPAVLQSVSCWHHNVSTTITINVLISYEPRSWIILRIPLKSPRKTSPLRNLAPF
jgi:hypothetical protein